MPRFFRCTVLSAIAVSLLALTAAAQSSCPAVAPGVTATYCLTAPAPGTKTVAFVAKDTKLYLITKGKAVSYPLPGSAALEDMLTFARANKKLTAEDILLIQAALPRWDSAKAVQGFTLLPDGLMYKIDQQGTGKKPEAGKRVSVHYKGYLADGKVFDNSYDRQQPIEFILGQGRVIKGWDQGIALFPVGSKGTLRIPPALGYGAAGAGGGTIPPNAVLWFDIEVVSAE